MDVGAQDLPSRRSVVAGPLVALITLVAGIVATQMADVPFRDPDHVAAKYVVLVGFSFLLLVGVDIAVRAGRRTQTRRPSRAAMLAVQRERWGWRRGVAVGVALGSFYVSYLAYRNIKSMVPLLRPGDLFDRELADVDRVMFAGQDPYELVHALLGTGFQTHVLSAVYAAFIVFLPLSLAIALVFHHSLRGGLFFATALSINWPLGAASYLLLPSLGPIYATPAEFAHLPRSEVTRLQEILLDDRLEFLRDPGVAGTAQHIAAFASLHVAMTFTAAVAGQLLGVGRRLRIALWAMFTVTMINTVYLGWHYFIDDIAGVAIAAAALALARLLTGFEPHRRRRVPEAAPEPA